MSSKNVLITQGHVYHSREEGAANSFRYPSYALLFNCSDELELKVSLKKKFFGFLSIQSSDFLKGGTASFDDNIKKFLAESCNYLAKEVWLQTMPRMIGYAFNPVSFWHCRRAGQLEAMLVEVNNTFGERHFYWIKPESGIANDQWYRAEKVFHVSPFFPVDGFYQFRFQISETKTRIDINYHAPNGNLRLATWVNGSVSPLSEVSFGRLVRKYGWISLFVVIRIHSQAFRLWLKKTKFYRKPLPPTQDVTK